MKKISTIILSTLILLLAIIVIIFCINNNNKDNNLTKVKVAEVAHSIFYAPQYVAISQGYFEDEGLDIELTLASGADAVMSAVLSKDVDIGFCGTEATIYVYQEGEEDYPMTFAGLTKRDGSFIVSREKIENFSLEDLKGKYIIGGRRGGMPEMTLEWTLKEYGIDPYEDLTIDTSIAFSAMQGAFIGGTGDFVTLFEPNALQVQSQGLGYIVAYLGELGGEVPYTAYNARNSYIKENPEIIESFTKAINKGLEFVKTNEAKTIADAIIDFFPDTSINDLTTIIQEYKDGDAWKDNITITKDEWEHIQEIIIEAGELNEYVPYEDLIYTKYFKDYE
jgi:NitT/TauT family transport system substrate-binding protein